MPMSSWTCFSFKLSLQKHCILGLFFVPMLLRQQPDMYTSSGVYLAWSNHHARFMKVQRLY